MEKFVELNETELHEVEGGGLSVSFFCSLIALGNAGYDFVKGFIRGWESV